MGLSDNRTSPNLMVSHENRLKLYRRPWTVENTGSRAMAELQVRVTAMSGRQVDLLLGAGEPIALLRQKVAKLWAFESGSCG